MSKSRIPNLDKYDAPTIENLLDTLIVGRNAERNRKIAKRHLIDGITFEELESEFGLTDRQIKRIVYKCEDRIFR